MSIAMDEIRQTAVLLSGRTIANVTWAGYDPRPGYGSLKLEFTDGTSVLVNYSCMGGVFVSPCGDHDAMEY